MIQLIGTIGLVAAAVTSTTFCLLYHLSARWWRSEEGWHLMSFTAALAVVFDWVTVRSFLAGARPVSLGVEIARAVIYCTIAALLMWRCWLLYRRQIRPGLKRERGRQ
ncbi:putative phage holin [Actinomadura rudentiformis]|uniref:Uncharacterized protein n=1 Tax=Actinomadura rudentiformis TaxID=359158 RepID=A0A6H9Z0H2_9ACTN|nr:hypothetical protein [Actinomadura rudentiformis]KAB2347361.1 hypothetical protein F8566_20325 [Actinomadura rudentiformis]